VAVSQAEASGIISCIFSCVASQHGNYAYLRLSADEWDENVESKGEYYLDFYRRLRGVTSWTVESEEVPVAPAKVNRPTNR